MRPLSYGDILALDGDPGSGWRATVGRLERPGCVATAYFQDGVRELCVELPDGRRFEALLLSTATQGGAERVCELAAA
jgi:hypothetical protein